MPPFSIEKAETISMHTNGYSELEVGRIVDMSKTAVHQAVSKFKISENCTDKKTNCWSKNTNARDDHVISRMECNLQQPPANRIN